ncbi:MAG: LysM peptidoglycan-binding domain-containing protein [Nitrospirae bacterium]|nr:LysM peptidoglycan-binding domain-containing protein [Nitrospirota bacterium]
MKRTAAGGMRGKQTPAGIRSAAAVACVVLLLIGFFPFSASAGLLLQHRITYTVAGGDTLTAIGTKMGVRWKKIADDNGLDPAKPLRAGLDLRVTISEIIPEAMESGILIDLPGRTLHLFERGVPVMSVPVGLGMPKKKGQKGWETPAGEFKIKGKLKSPDWKVPESIQEEMRREGLVLKESYPPGPKNPVGGYVLQTTFPGILIHDTIDQSSLFQYKSHGCVRLLRTDMEQLFGNVRSGTSGKITYSPVKIAQVENGRIFMEVNRDAYERTPDMQAYAQKLLRKAGLFRKVDLKKVERLVQAGAGIPEEITAGVR